MAGATPAETLSRWTAFGAERFPLPGAGPPVSAPRMPGAPSPTCRSSPRRRYVLIVSGEVSADRDALPLLDKVVQRAGGSDMNF